MDIEQIRRTHAERARAAGTVPEVHRRLAERAQGMFPPMTPEAFAAYQAETRAQREWLLGRPVSDEEWVGLTGQRWPRPRMVLGEGQAPKSSE